MGRDLSCARVVAGTGSAASGMFFDN